MLCNSYCHGVRIREMMLSELFGPEYFALVGLGRWIRSNNLANHPKMKRYPLLTAQPCACIIECFCNVFAMFFIASDRYLSQVNCPKAKFFHIHQKQPHPRVYQR